MAANLVIVESPAKAKTIGKLLGDDFLVKPSFGHIRDLAKKNYGIDIKNNFKPVYEVDAEKKHVVAELKKLVKTADTVWLASDEDREGEAIAWHLAVTLKLPVETTKRIVFHEITQTAIRQAIENPRTIDLNLVDAQQARRILDRLVGFELSEVLWKKVKSQLSAGRVQSVAVKLIVEREREIFAFKPQTSFKPTALFSLTDKKTSFKADFTGKITTETDSENFLSACNGSNFVVSSVEKKPAKKSPAPPFTTSTLQQEASRKLGFSVSQTMMLAQQLYEAGHITYMRTDSVNLSDFIIKACKKYICDNYGEDYSKSRNYVTKTKGAQEAHEAIRPTTMNSKVSDRYDEQALYDIIFKRTMASQMADARIERTTVTVNADKPDYNFSAQGEIITFDGFIKVYKESFDDEPQSDLQILPALKPGDDLNLVQIEVNQRFTHAPARFTEAGLVKRLEELGIGRPSTYAPIITTVIKRGYVVKEDRSGTTRNYLYLLLKNGKITKETKQENTGFEKSKLYPTDIAIVVTDFLSKYFTNVMDYNFTATVEKDFDDIAEGKTVWFEMLEKFYSPFHETVGKTIVESERNDGERILGVDPESGKNVHVRIGRFGPIVQLGESDGDQKPVYVSLKRDQHIETVTLEDALELLKSESGGRLLGVDPQSGKNVYARVGRFGAMIQLGENNTEQKPRYASLLKGQNVDTITLAQALKLLELPRSMGDYNGKPVTVSVGRFGPYVSYNSKFVSLKKTDNPLTLTFERCIELILEKEQSDAKRLIKEFAPDFKITRDRWSNPVIYYKKKYYKLAKDTDAQNLSQEDCFKIMGVDPNKTTVKKSSSASEKKSSSKTKK